MALGRGLQSLIPPKKTSKKAQNLPEGVRLSKEVVFSVEIDKIKPNPFQPRREIPKESLEELAESIREHGVLQPLLVTQVEVEKERGGRDVEYHLIAGERRWRAAKMAGLPSVPVIIRNTTRREKLELALVENIQRENLNPIEAGMAFQMLHDEFGLKYQQIAEKLGKSRTAIINTVRLLDLPEKIKQGILSGLITEGHARAILMVEPDKRFILYERILREKLSVREAEEAAREIMNRERVFITRPSKAGVIDPELRLITKHLQEVLKTPVKIQRRGEFNDLVIRFLNQKDLNKFIKKLKEIFEE